MILPIKGYEKLNQAYILHADVVDVKLFVDFFAAREGNKIQTVNGNN